MTPPPPPDHRPAPLVQAAPPFDATAYRRLALRDKVAQLVFARIGSNMEPAVTVEEDRARVGALLERCALGGLIVFNGRREATPRTLEALQAESRIPLLVGADLERGAGQQLHGATLFPHARAFAACGEEAEALVEAAAEAAAREARACGVHVTFAPVADVHRNPQNPIIATRAFGETPEVASRLVRAYLRGARAGGILTTAKHFPGHGGTSEDSHATLPRVEDDRETLERLDLAPFRAAVEGGVDLVMTAHVAYPALDPSGAPATLSRPILHDLLRGDLGFRGPVISDSMLMGAVQADDGDVGAQAAALFAAGADILLDPRDPEAVVTGLVRAVEEGRLEESALDASLARVWALKAHARPNVTFGLPATHSDHEALADRVARRAVTVVSGEARRLPLPADEPALVVLVKPFRTRLEADEAPLGAAVRRALPSADYAEAGPEANAATLEAVARRADAAAHVVVVLVVKPSAWQAFGLLPAQQGFVERLVARRPVLLASLGSADVLTAFPAAALRLCTYSDVPRSQQALADVLANGPHG